MSHDPILILGMHRSGTSCLAGSLQQRGLYLGEVYEHRPHNRKGNRENQRVMDLNEAILAASGGGWDRPPARLRWDDALAGEADAIVAGFAAGSDGAPWGFKDPRTLLTLPFWLERLPSARCVATFRHPVRVARSLNARDPSMSMDAGLDLWLHYNRRLLALLVDAPAPVVCFDVDPATYARGIDALADHLGLPGDRGDAPPFFEAALRHQPAGLDQPLPDAHLATYEALLDAAGHWR